MILLFLAQIKHLKVKDVVSILGLKDQRATKKWLRDNGVPISKLGGHNVVDNFLFEFKRQQLHVEELRISYPNSWFEIYDAQTSDKAMVKSIRTLYPETKSVNKSKSNGITKFIK